MAKLFQKDRLVKKLNNSYKKGLTEEAKYWNFGYPMLSDAFPALRSGIGLIFANENIGKSAFACNIGVNTLMNDPNTFWMDFSLDDSEDDRFGYLLACYGKIKINDIKNSADSTKEQKEKRKLVYSNWSKNFGERYEIVALSDDEDIDLEDPSNTPEIRYAEYIGELIQDARKQIGKDAKLLVTIDGFHDVETMENLDELVKQKVKGTKLNEAASRANALIISTAHQIKHTRSRAVSTDDMYGAAALKYRAKFLIHLYSEYKELEDNANIVWQLSDGDTEKIMPVVEAKIAKNKAGDFGGRIFYNFLPANCYMQEADTVEQKVFASYIKGGK